VGIISGSGGGGSGIGALLFDSTLGANANAIDTGAGGIAGSQSVLEVFVIARTDDAAANAVLLVTFNNDGGANYDLQVDSGQNVTASAGIRLAATSLQDFTVHGAGGSASYAASLYLCIPGYAQTTFFKTGIALGSTNDGTAANNLARAYTFSWRNTAAITRMKVAQNGAGNLLAGSRLLILGR
jgi:hypothetical protein